MKKFDIKNAGPNKWLVSHNEFPKFSCSFEDKRFNYQRTITGLSDPSGDVNENTAENGKMAKTVS